MRTYTGSTNCDDRAKSGKNKGRIMVNLKENARDPEEIARLNEQYIQNGKPPKYDINKASMNIYYETCLTEEEAFEHVFGESMERYNQAQKRADRKTSMEKELAKLSKGKVQQELIHCMVVQIGNHEEHPPIDECVEILQEYRERFIRQFPNMRIVSCSIHLDELDDGTPHLQMYYTPVKTKEQHEAMGSSKKWSGMDVQPSLTGALEQMGYTNDATILVPKKDEYGEPIMDENGEPVMVEKHDYKNGAMAQWQRDFNGLLDEICMEHDIAIDHYMRGKQVSHQDTRDYYDGKINKEVARALHDKEKVDADLTNALLDVENAQEEKKKLQAENQLLKTENAALRTDNEALRTNNRTLEQKAHAAEDRLAKAQGAFSRFMAAVSSWVDAHTGLQRILRTAWRLSDAHRDKIETRAEDTVKRGYKAITKALESPEDILAAEREVEQGTKTFQALRTAVKEDQDPDELLDGMEL